MLDRKVKSEHQLSLTHAALSLDHAEVLLLELASKALIAFAVLWVGIIILMRERISLAVTLLKESATALIDVPQLLLFPLIMTLVMAGFAALFLTYSVYLVSSADIETVHDSLTGISYKKLYWSEEAQIRIGFLFFCWVWTAGFMQSVGHVSRA